MQHIHSCGDTVQGVKHKELKTKSHLKHNTLISVCPLTRKI